MRKFRLLFILALLLLPVSALAQATSNQYKTITVGWNPATVGGSVYPACNFTASPAVNTACVNGYEEVLTAPNSSSVTIPPCSATVTALCLSLSNSAYTWAAPNNGFLLVGTWTATIYVAYLDANGAQQFTAGASGTGVVPNPTGPPSAVTGLKVTPGL